MSRKESYGFRELKKVSKDKKLLVIFLAISLLGNIFYALALVTNYRPANLPRAEVLVDEHSYAFSYDLRNKNPAWVMEIIKEEDTLNLPEISNAEFVLDSGIPENFRPGLDDYRNTGFDVTSLLVSPKLIKSHLVYPLITASPQNQELAKGYWVKFNDYVRQLPKSIGVKKALVITQPLYLSQEGSKKGEQVTYSVIGENNIAVPTHFLRMIFYPLPGQENRKFYAVPAPSIGAPVPPPVTSPLKVKGEVYMIPNAAIEEGIPLENFRIRNWEDAGKFLGIILPKDLSSYLED